MKRLALVLCFLLVATTVLTSCGKEPTQTTTSTTVTGTVSPTSTMPTTSSPTTTAPTTSTTTTTTPSAGPKYGGWLTIAQSANITIWDRCIQSGHSGALMLTNEAPMGGDWTKGPAGTGEYTLKYGYEDIPQQTGLLAESWEIPAIGEYILHVRKGVNFAINAGSEASKLVNGRQFTGKDMAYNLERALKLPTTTAAKMEPLLSAAAYVTQEDDWTVTVHTPVGPFNGWKLGVVEPTQYPPELIAKYGDMTDWHNNVGTGPYILTDFVNNSSATLVRNPNYWDKDPIGPGKGNQLPYLDGVKILVITDASTRMAALRTAKIDWLRQIPVNDAMVLQQSMPELKYDLYKTAPDVIGMRQDNPAKPFSKIGVRQALMMAIDWNSLKNDLYAGQADILAWPLQPVKAYEKSYIPLDQQPAVVQELYSHNVDKAKKLLADAGYANGFDTTVICESNPQIVDLLSVIKDMWAKIGVNLTIDVREAAVIAGIQRPRNYEDMLYRWSPPALDKYANYLDLKVDSGMFNVSYINDPVVEEANRIQEENIFVNWDAVYKAYRDMIPHLLEQSYVIPMPAPNYFMFWWPWIGNYHGEAMVNSTSNVDNGWVKWAWLEQGVKTSMGK